MQVEYQAGGRLSSLLDTDLQYQVEVRGKTVDASYLTTQVLWHCGSSSDAEASKHEETFVFSKGVY